MLSFGGTMIAAVVLVSASGAAAAAPPTTARIDLSTRTAVTKYLRTIRVNPTRVVVQRGLRNYAGPSCPGAGWTCTSTSHPVVQVARAAGQNVFQCSTSHCAVVQTAISSLATNTAKCIKITGLSQSCSISQSSSSANNQAIVVEIATKASGLTQSASQTAQIIQKATGGLTAANSNTACVLQTTNVDGSTVGTSGTLVTVSLDAHQSISIKQDSANGNNSVKNATSGGSCADGPLTQAQTLTSSANGLNGITQNENAGGSGPNLTLDIEQNQSTGFLGSATGQNSSAFAQTSTLSAAANTPAGPVSQTQSSPGGGLQANVNQFSHGVSTSTAKQSETQCEHAQSSGITSGCDATAHTPTPPPYTFTQTQFGPVRCCSNQADNSGDTFNINQSSIQSNDSGSNQTNNVQADCTTSGTCTATQTTTVNGSTTTNTQTGSDVHTQITCSGSSCTPTGGRVTFSGNTVSASNTDIGEFGFGGMRGNGVGTIAVSGISGTVTKALLYWNGPTNSTDPAANAAVTFAGTPITGTNIGFASDNNWGFANSQSYRADVTTLVAGNGSYSLSNFDKPGVEVNGAALIVFYNDGNTANDRNIVLWNGNDSNVASSFDAAGWDETIVGVPYPGSGSASLDLVVSDGQSYADDALVVNGNTIAGPGSVFDGNSTPAGSFSGNPAGVTGSLWDVKSFGITSLLSPGSNSLHVTTGVNGADALSLVVAIANMPASGTPIG